MRVFWEKVGMLGPVYRLARQGFSDHDIAEKLNLAELSVQACIAWIFHFLGLTTTEQLQPRNAMDLIVLGEFL
jgi:DNA-binding NarL/FixJ family response regulator